MERPSVGVAPQRLDCLIKQGYALTEGYPAIRMGSADPAINRISSAGRCVPNTECKVVDPKRGAELGPSQPGELWLRGPQVMQGYLHQPAATAQMIDRRWLVAHGRHGLRRRGWLLHYRRPAQGADQVQGIPGCPGRAGSGAACSSRGRRCRRDPESGRGCRRSP